MQKLFASVCIADSKESTRWRHQFQWDFDLVHPWLEQLKKRVDRKVVFLWFKCVRTSSGHPKLGGHLVEHPLILQGNSLKQEPSYT